MVDLTQHRKNININIQKRILYPVSVQFLNIPRFLHIPENQGVYLDIETTSIIGIIMAIMDEKLM